MTYHNSVRHRSYSQYQPNKTYDILVHKLQSRPLLQQIIFLKFQLIILIGLFNVACDLQGFDQGPQERLNDTPVPTTVKYQSVFDPNPHRSLIDLSTSSAKVPWAIDIRVVYSDRIYDHTGYTGEHVLRSAPSVRVDLTQSRSVGEDILVASTYTDLEGVARLRWRDIELGAYFDKSGRWIGGQLTASVVSELRSSHGHQAQVSSRRGGELYRLEAVLNPHFVMHPKPSMWAPYGEVRGEPIELIAPSEGMLSGALNIISMLSKGYEMIGEYSQDLGPRLVVS